MTLSNCCGAVTIAETRSDHPHVYDDEYDLKITLLLCTECGKIVGLDSKNGNLEDSNT